MDGLREGLGDDPNPAVKKDTGEVGSGFDIGGVSTAAQGNRHFFRGFGQRISDDFKSDGVNLLGMWHRRSFCFSPNTGWKQE